jgi:anti-sigma B factor antagonist
MPLTISSRADAGIAILEVTGNLTLGPRLRTFQSSAERALTKQGCAGLVLNFAGLSALDSAGIGELVKIHSRAVSRGVSVVLVKVSSHIKEVLAITRVDSLFTFADDERSALREIRGC